MVGIQSVDADVIVMQAYCYGDVQQVYVFLRGLCRQERSMSSKWKAEKLRWGFDPCDLL